MVHVHEPCFFYSPSFICFPPCGQTVMTGPLGGGLGVISSLHLCFQVPGSERKEVDGGKRLLAARVVV